MCKMNILPWRPAREAGIGREGGLQPRSLWAGWGFDGRGRGQIKMNVGAYSEICAAAKMKFCRR